MGPRSVAVLFLAGACSDYTVANPLDNATGVGPDVVVDPPTLDFGALPEHTEVSRTVRIANRGGSTLHVERLLLGPSPVFLLPTNLAPVDVEPGEAVLQEVRYVATDAHDASWLRIVSDDPDHPELDVPMAGAALVPELTIEPDPQEFGEIWCSESAFVALHNTGGAPLTVNGVLVEGSKFALAQEVAVPQIVPAGGAITAEVVFTPGTGAIEHLGRIVVDSDDRRGVRSGTLLGSGTEPPSHVDTFEQVENDWTRTDILFFVDQSCSMGDDAANLGSNLETFTDILTAGGIDYQLVVTNGDDGCRDTPIITPSTPNAADVFSLAAQSGGGMYTEAGMIVTRNAIEQTDPGECNAGLLRGDGVVPIAVLVSDEPEQSPGGYQGYLSDIQGKAPDLAISTVVGQPGSPCAANGTGYHESAAATGGADLEICGADWGSYFYDILGVIEPPLSSFALSATPNPDTIAVEIDGLPAGGWSYDGIANAVVFAQVALPPPASVIVVAYDEPESCP